MRKMFDNPDYGFVCFFVQISRFLQLDMFNINPWYMDTTNSKNSSWDCEVFMVQKILFFRGEISYLNVI